MTGETYTARMRTAEKLAEAFARVPEQKRPLLAAMMECMLTGAELALSPAAPPPQGAERPSA